MSDRMTPIPFSQLVEWIMQEYKTNKTIFGIYQPYQADQRYNRSIFGRDLETPIGPAAGPHTQLAQNIAAAYYTGSRFFELKTVQVLDGEDLPVAKPCIIADDECYNCEWSTELYIPQARDEYVKAWFLLHILAKEFDLGVTTGFQFNMSVGYDLEGIKTPKIDNFIETMKDAQQTEIFKECQEYLLNNLDQFKKISKEDVLQVSPKICNSVTLSTLHGCPPQEIERIASYLMEEKGLNTFIKCNPTLLGYEFARATMDEMGYDYIAFGDFHFLDDLQYQDAVPMIQRLLDLADRKTLSFGVKITNTFPVDVKQQELPSEEMYMSGKSLYPLSITLAARLSKEFAGKLRISFSGGADFFNLKPMVDAGIWPVTVATTLLKPGGYQRMVQLVGEVEEEGVKFEQINVEKLSQIAKDALTDPHHLKAIKPLPSRKLEQKVPLTDCYFAPCQGGCPISQDIPTYMKLTGEGKYLEALQVIVDKNPLPFITGTICAHNCMTKCTRNFYEEPVHIREMKLVAAENGFKQLMEQIQKTAPTNTKKVAVVGGGPAGLSAAYFLARAGVSVTLFEKREKLGGIIRYVIPEFRIPDQSIDHDVALVEAMGVEVKLGTAVTSISDLKAQGFDDVILAIGAYEKGILSLKSGDTVNAIDFLEQYKASNGEMNIGKSVVVIGGGNTAMDTARAAKRVKGVEHVYLVYRRTKRYMPADEEELIMALDDGIEFKELLAPESWDNGQLTCRVMTLSEVDESGRRGVTQTEEVVKIPADLVIGAIGEQVPTALYKENDIAVTERGKAKVDAVTLETSQKGVYVVGDGLYGPATVVEAIRDALQAVEAITKASLTKDHPIEIDNDSIYQKRGILEEKLDKEKESERCLVCSNICENCVEVCPNRANIWVYVPEQDRHQIIHVDYMCNECGNCKSFCPYDSAPYLDKFTLFANEKDMSDSKNQGFTVTDVVTGACQVRYADTMYSWTCGQDSKDLPEDLRRVMEAAYKTYSYLLLK